MSIRASHLLCKHEGSRNPVSRRTGASTQDITKEEAQREITKILAEINASDNPQVEFSKRAAARSDCGSFQQKGDLGEFGRGAMVKSFEDAAFSLEVGQISGVVDGDSGYHIILRTA